VRTYRRGRAALIALALGGCSGFGASTPPPQDPNLFPAEFRAEIAQFMRTYLENPTKVRDAFVSTPALKPIGGASRYVACVRYNPRDSRNRYQGNEERIAIFWAGRLNQFLAADREQCSNAVYQRFPEAEVLVP
jgi:hypothetical protein